MFKFLLLIALIPALALGQAVNVRSCRNQPAPTQVRIAGCTQMPCSVVRGTDAVMTLDFIPNRPVSRITPAVRASVLGLPVNYPLPEHLLNPCNYLLNGHRCPIPAYRPTSLVFRFPVNQSYPPISVGVELRLTDQNNQVVACFGVDIQVRTR